MIVLGYDISQKRKKLANIRQLLRTGGRLLLFDVSYEKDHASSLPLAILPHWWPDDDDDICHSTTGESNNEPGATPRTLARMALMVNRGEPNEAQKQTMFEECGFSSPQAIIHANGKIENYRISSIFLTAIGGNPSLEPIYNAIVIARWLPNGVKKSQVEAAIQGCRSVALAWFDFDELKNFDLEGKYCVILDDPQDSYLTGMNSESFEGLKCLTQAAGILWTIGGLSSPSAGLVRGLARTLRAEFQMDKFVTLTVDDWDMSGELLMNFVGRVFEQSFYVEDPSGGFDRGLAVNDGVVYIPRLVRDDLMDQDLERETQKGAKTLQPFHQPDRPLRITITNPGFLDTLSFTDDDRLHAPLPKDKIEIQTKAFGLNFKDVILALGQLPGYYLGQECSGVVTRAGSNTLGLNIGDRCLCYCCRFYSQYHTVQGGMCSEIARRNIIFRRSVHPPSLLYCPILPNPRRSTETRRDHPYPRSSWGCRPGRIDACAGLKSPCIRDCWKPGEERIFDAKVSDSWGTHFL